MNVAKMKRTDAKVINPFGQQPEERRRKLDR